MFYRDFLRIGFDEVIFMSGETLKLPHKLTLDQRSRLTLTGVTEVVSFDETAVALHTQLGVLQIQGQGLKLKQLSAEGSMEVSGTIAGLFYEEPRAPGGFWSRLLK